jgi:hypothetical protein
MTDLGFFRLTGNRYQTTIPSQVSGSEIEATLLRLTATEDEQCFLHPEHLVTSLSKTDAQEWQLRLVRCLGYNGQTVPFSWEEFRKTPAALPSRQP